MLIYRVRQTISVAIFAALALAFSAPSGHAAAAGAIDPTFRSDPYPLQEVRAAAPKLDGRIAIGGIFQTFSGATPMSFAAVMGSNGALDTGFGDPLINADVYAVAAQADGKILVAGDFNQVGATPRSRVARLNANGSLDGSFDPPSLDGNVYSVALQPDGKVIIGGTFASRVARLNANGSLDTSFSPPGLNDWVRSVALQPDGKVIIGGDFFSTTGGAPVTRQRVARLNADGSLDTGFGNPGIICRGGGTPGTGQECLGVFAYVDSIAVQADGKLVVAGLFDSVQGNTNIRGVARLNADGSLDTGFVPPGINMAASVLRQATLQLDGKLIVAGSFYRTAAPATQTGALRLNSDGTVDSDFAAVPIGSPPNPPFSFGGSTAVFAAPLQDDGKLILAGYFQINSGGTQYFGLARIHATAPQAAPTSVSATAGDAQASVSWTPLTGEISNYTVTASPGGASCTTASSSCTITGLANGTSYTFGVRATNSFGPGPARQSNAVTPTSGGGGGGGGSTPSVSVSSVKSKVSKKGAYITSRVRVSGAGRISQRATTGSSRRLKTWCRASRAATRAGTQTLKCNLGSKGRKALKKSSLKLTLRTGFTPAGGSAVFANKALTIKRKR